MLHPNVQIEGHFKNPRCMEALGIFCTWKLGSVGRNEKLAHILLAHARVHVGEREAPAAANVDHGRQSALM